MIGHKKGHGKDTLAEMLNRHIPNSKVFAFAHPMRDIMATAKGMTIPEYKNAYNDDPVLRREIQSFGNDKMKEYFGENVWVDLLLQRAYKDDAEYIIVSDFRFPIEHIEDSITIRITRPELEDDDTHESEKALDDFNFDIEVMNNGTKFQLEVMAMALANHVKSHFKEDEKKDDPIEIINECFNYFKKFNEGGVVPIDDDVVDSFTYLNNPLKGESLIDLKNVTDDDDMYKTLLRDDEHEENMHKVYDKKSKHEQLKVKGDIFIDDVYFGNGDFVINLK